MAQTNYTPIQLYYSTTAAAVPVNTNLLNGELAINITDGKLYYKDNSGTVQVIATKGAGTIGGSTTQIQYNNAGALAGSSDMTYTSATNTVLLTKLNLTNALGEIYGGTGQSTYTTGDLLYSSASNTLAKLAIGTANYILTVNSGGTNVQWSAPSSISVSTATNLAGGVAGSVPYQSGASTTTFLGIGAADRVMTSSGSAPQWVTALTGLTGVSSSSITNTSLASTRVVYSGASGVQTDSANLTFDGTTLTTAGLSNSGTSALVKLVTVGNTSFSGTTVFAPSTPAKLYMGTGTVTDATSAIGATNAVGAVASLAITPIAATNTSVTYTDAATLYIAGAPSAGTNITITNPFALYVAAGASYLGGNTAVTGTLSATGGTSVATSSGYLTVGTVSATGMNASDIGIPNNKYLRGTVAAGTSSVALIGLDPSNSVQINANGSSGGTNVTGTFSSTLGATIQGLTVGLGGGAVATNTAVGASALAGSNTGINNTAIGSSALVSNTSGNRNVAVGSSALFANTTGVENTAVGHDVASSNTSGSYNVVVGRSALSTNTSGSYNTAIGMSALALNTTASYNTAVGYNSLRVNTTGTENTSMGQGTMSGNTTGSYNAAYSNGALGNNTTGSNNTALGYFALVNNTTASYNTAVGYQAGYLVTGGANLCIGASSGAVLTTGANNIHLGNTSASSTGASQEIVLGATNGSSVVGKGSNTGFIYAGAGGVYQGNNSASWSTTSDRRLKKNIVDNTVGLYAITSIRVCNFEYRLPEEVDAELKPTDAIDKSGVQLGVIAQELQQVLPECVKTESTGVMSVDTDNLTWYMINAIKELNAKVQALETQLNQGA